jgi:hypothetical protein
MKKTPVNTGVFLLYGPTVYQVVRGSAIEAIAGSGIIEI